MNKEQDVYFGNVAGVTFHDEGEKHPQEVIRSLITSKNKTLYLIREPNNPYDKSAVKVITVYGKKVGYLPKDLAKIVGPEMDKGERFFTIFRGVTGGGNNKRLGLNIHIKRVKKVREVSNTNVE